jgi:hypothetical protein
VTCTSPLRIRTATSGSSPRRSSRRKKRSYEREPIPIGVYYEATVPTYEDEIYKRIPALKDTPLAEMDTFKRDINPLLESMR